MKGKSSPTAKLESQLTVPAIMNAAGRCDCWKNSPVRTNGIPPERGYNKSVVLVNCLCQQLFPLQGCAAHAVLHTSVTSSHCSTALCWGVRRGFWARKMIFVKIILWRIDTSFSHTTASPVLHPLTDSKQVTEQWIHTTASRVHCDELFINNDCFY